MKETIPRSEGNTYCKKLTPKQKPYDIHDSQVRGLVFRVMPTGSKYWILRLQEMLFWPCQTTKEEIVKMECNYSCSLLACKQGDLKISTNPSFDSLDNQNFANLLA